MGWTRIRSLLSAIPKLRSYPAAAGAGLTEAGIVETVGEGENGAGIPPQVAVTIGYALPLP